MGHGCGLGPAICGRCRRVRGHAGMGGRHGRRRRVVVVRGCIGCRWWRRMYSNRIAVAVVVHSNSVVVVVMVVGGWVYVYIVDRSVHDDVRLAVVEWRT